MQNAQNAYSQAFQSTTSIRRLTGTVVCLPKNLLYFNPQPPSGGWRLTIQIKVVIINFNPQPPSGGWQRVHYIQLRKRHFNPQPPSGGWLVIEVYNHIILEFQSTTSIRRLTSFPISSCSTRYPFQSTTSIRRLTCFNILFAEFLFISIHNLHPEVDGVYEKTDWTAENFNPQPPSGGWPFSSSGSISLILISIHNLHPEVDFPVKSFTITVTVFQSTTSIRRLTILILNTLGLARNFNPQPPSGGWRSHAHCLWGLPGYFNPQPPSGGWPAFFCGRRVQVVFQSTTSIRRLTKGLRNPWADEHISIHNLHPEVDGVHHRIPAVYPWYFNPQPPSGGWRESSWQAFERRGYFNPQPPSGGWLPVSSTSQPLFLFQSTTSIRRLTSPVCR